MIAYLILFALFFLLQFMTCLIWEREGLFAVTRECGYDWGWWNYCQVCGWKGQKHDSIFVVKLSLWQAKVNFIYLDLHVGILLSNYLFTKFVNYTFSSTKDNIFAMTLFFIPTASNHIYSKCILFRWLLLLDFGDLPLN